MSNLRADLPPLSALAPFEAAARLGSFKQAAEELNLTQAAISRQIRVLETDLGVALFVRRHRAVELTEAGRRFADESSDALSRLAMAARAERRAAASEAVTVMCELALAAHWLIPRLATFQNRRPEIEIRLLATGDPPERVGEPVDIALQTGRRGERRFDLVHSAPETVFAVAAPALLESAGGRLPASALARRPLLHFVDRLRDWVEWPEFLATFGVPSTGPLGGLRFNSYPVLAQAAMDGHGIALGWRRSLDARLKDGTLGRISDDALTFEEGVCLYRARGAGGDPKRRATLDWLAGELDADRDP
ncbi:MAG: LysR substrate-binding domain-containing protein [Marivibrio sp.]|uniref:LysR substrate-binding domain-containing protein n=1 Tax=Marivibrio sp. TaxID=2039719 RepID=UPI0032EB59B3